MPAPAGAAGDAVLEFAGVFADEEREVGAVFKGKVGGEDLVEKVEAAAGLRGAAEPMGAWGERFEPTERGGEQKLAAGADERGEMVEELAGIGQAAEEIGGEDEVEGRGDEVGGVALPEIDARAVDAGRDEGEAGRGEIAFDRFVVGMFAVGAEVMGGADEGVGKIEAEDRGAVAGEFKTRTTDRAAEVERLGVWICGSREERADKPRGEADGFDGAGEITKHVGGRAVVEEEIFGEELRGFVGIRIHRGGKGNPRGVGSGIRR